MLTGYWSIDAFIIANILLCLLVIVVFIFCQRKGSGMLEDSPEYQTPKE